MEIQPQNMPHASRALMVFASHWGTTFGGINSFNTDFLSALRLVLPPDVGVVCIVLNSDSERTRTKANVEILSLQRGSDTVFSASFLPEVLRLLAVSGVVPNEHTVWLGHDRITGAIAVAAAKQMGGRSSVIHHMSYAHYEAYAETAQTASDKEEEQRAIFSHCDVPIAVGPVLRDGLRDMLGNAIPMLVPGLPDIPVAPVPHTFTGFISGRISSDTAKIKQAHLGVAAFADAIRRANGDQTLPDNLQSKNNPSLKVRGLQAEQPADGNIETAEMELKHFSESYAGRVINLRALSFTTNREGLFDELRRASLALLPSWHEGFGLVAWEAIGAGVPLIISNKSGVYRLLEEYADGLYSSLVRSIDIRGKIDEPFFRDEDLREVSDAIIHVAKDPQAARANAARLREALLTQGFTWEKCAKQFVGALGWQLPSPPPLPQVIVEAHAVSLAQPIPLTTVDPLEFPSPQWTLSKGLSISQLLRAEEAVVPFDDRRQPFLDSQLLWAETDEFPIALRLIVGGGGVGKTRLALELCRILKEKTWWAGFLPDGQRSPTQLTNVIARLREHGEPALIIIDYAETRISDLLGLVKPLLSLTSTRAIRVLLLARSGGEWWDRLAGADPACEALFAGRANSGPFEIPPLYDTVAGREAAFRSAIQLFGDKLRLPVPTVNVDLSADYYAQPLLVQMAAMMALHGEHPQSAEALTRSLVNHERRYWANLLVGTSTTADQAAQLMALSTLANGLQIPRLVETIWSRARCGTAADLKYLFGHLRQLYPGRVGLEGLQPDLLGEALVAQVLLASYGPSLLDALLAAGDARTRHHALTILARLLRYRADIIPTVQNALYLRYENNVAVAADVCRQTPSPLPQLLEDSFDSLSNNRKLQVSGQLSAVVQEESLPLDGLALRVAETVAAKARLKAERTKTISAGDQRALARSLGNLALALHRVGREREALEASGEALQHWTHLAAIRPSEFRKNLAKALGNYGGLLAENGRVEEAVEPSRQAVEITEELAAADSGFLNDWATALNNHSNALAEVGRVEEALVLSEKALKMREGLAEDDPEQFEPVLAISLGNYSIHLANSAREAEAIKFAKRALDIYRRLAENKPERFEPDLAYGLGLYGSRLAENGELELALQMSRQSLHIRERLAKSKPVRFEPDWALSLNNHALVLSQNGLVKEALALCKHALDIRARLAQEEPERFESDWASSLVNYAGHLRENGQFDEAVTYSEQALRLRERIAATKPERFQPHLAAALATYYICLNASGRYAEAVIAAEQTSELYARLAAKLPLVFTGSYQSTVSSLALSRWLSNPEDRSITVSLPAEVDMQSVTLRERMGIAVLQYTVCACLEDKLVDQGTYSTHAINQWRKLDKATQWRWEDCFLVAASIAERALGKSWDEVILSDRRSRYKAMLQRRNGAVPAWMKTIEARLSLPAI